MSSRELEVGARESEVLFHIYIVFVLKNGFTTV